MKRYLLRMADAADGKLPIDPPAPESALPAEPPPAATVVVNGEITEELLQTRGKLEESEKARKKAETDAAHFQDETRRLKEAGLRPAPPAPAPADTRSALEKFMDGEDV